MVSAVEPLVDIYILSYTMKKSFSLKALILLTAAASLGFILRIYNLDFPSIGYHNMKENEYLSMAQEMKKTQDFITRRVYFYNAFDDTPIMEIFPQIPMISYQTLIAWKFFGENMWSPRLFNVIFGTLSIIIIYFTAYLLFNNISLALFCAFLLAIMPLGVFFSRNLQPESPAFFFMLLGNLFYLRYCAFFKKYDLFWGGISFSIAWIYKSTFIFGIIPFLACFNFKTIFKKKNIDFRLILAFLSPFLLIFISQAWIALIGQNEFQQGVLKRINIFQLYLPSYWKTYGGQIWHYAWQENFAKIPLLLALSGIFISICKKKGLAERYIIGWTITAVLYGMFFSDFLNQHNYYQMPFLILICAASAYTAGFISEILKKIAFSDNFLRFSRDYLKYLLGIIAGAAMPLAFIGLQAMHKIIFFGADIAGESLKEFTKPNERIFLYTHCQGYGIARYAHRYMSWPDNLEKFKENEKKLNIQYICVYPMVFFRMLESDNPGLFKYIQGNYRPKEAGFIMRNKRLNEIYIILKKGRGFKPMRFFQFDLNNLKLKKTYKIFKKNVYFYSLRYPD